ncbi:MAG: hypothetical protein JOZ96_29905 [Acidobacteria bacterium]|nr:hypothetical protein [Acidobacteriota bacterium]
MFLVTFHGGRGKGSVHQLYSYKDDGSGGAPYLTAATPSGKTGLRDVQFRPAGKKGNFYLVNSSKSCSQIFQIAPGATSLPEPYVGGVCGKETSLCSVYHPFAVCFDEGMETCYISNQDTNVVVRVAGPLSQVPEPGQPLPVAPALLKLPNNPTFLPGTFVASQQPYTPGLPGCPTPTAVTAAQGGLGASGSGATPSHSVRGLDLVESLGILYVADETDNCIRTYKVADGEYLGAVKDPQSLVNSPTHVLAVGTKVYVGVSPSKGNKGALVLCYDAEADTLSAVVSNDAKQGVDVKHPSGLTFDGAGNFYMADLNGRAVYKFASDFTPAGSQPFISGLPDSPEFIFWLNDKWVGA